MDRLSQPVIEAMEILASKSEDIPVSITQDLECETLNVTAENFGVHKINCAWNSQSATIRQFCRELSERTLLKYQEES